MKTIVSDQVRHGSFQVAYKSIDVMTFHIFFLKIVHEHCVKLITLKELNETSRTQRDGEQCIKMRLIITHKELFADK